jgi:tetratricopeptide (TPR) repeat protein
MNVGIFLLAAAATLPAFCACQFTPAETETYRRAAAPDVPFSERREAFQRSIEACPGDADLYRAFAALLIANRDFSNALPWIDKGLRLAPDDAVLNLRKGESLTALGQAEAGLAALSKVPQTGETQFFRGLAYQQLEDHRQAQECFLDAWKRGNEDAYVLYSLMREDRELGDKRAGLEHFQLMMKRFPNSVWMHVLLGDAHFQKGEEAQARQEYTEAVQLTPDLFEANFRLAYLAFEAGQNSSAVDYYRRALAVKPHHSEANVYLGEALRREGRISEAVQQLRHALEMDPKAALAYDSLAKALADGGRPAEAAVVLSAAEKNFPDNSAFPAMRARLLTKLGRTEEAKAESRRALEVIAEKNKKAALVH